MVIRLANWKYKILINKSIESNVTKIIKYCNNRNYLTVYAIYKTPFMSKNYSSELDESTPIIHIREFVHAPFIRSYDKCKNSR